MVRIQLVVMEPKFITYEIFFYQIYDVALIATDFGKLIDFREELYTLSEILKLKSFNIKPNLDLPEYPICNQK